MTENNTKPVDMPAADNSIIRNINRNIDPYTNGESLGNSEIRAPFSDSTIIRSINEKNQ